MLQVICELWHLKLRDISNDLFLELNLALDCNDLTGDQLWVTANKQELAFRKIIIRIRNSVQYSHSKRTKSATAKKINGKVSSLYLILIGDYLKKT